jgi:large subunit ribosomal protein L32
MGALPKRKLTKGRQGNRRSQQFLTMPTLEVCPQCKSVKRAHQVCHECGTYRGMQILPTKEAAAE